MVSQDPVARFVETQIPIPPQLERAAQQAIQRPFHRAGSSGQSLLSFLHGDWLHEPLHAVLTDVPVGAWTVTVAADAISGMGGSRSMDDVADTALAVGLIGAAGAAITGLADWSEVEQAGPRRLGAVHALLNIGATTLFAASCFARRSHHRRSAARSMAVAGYLIAFLSAHLGGTLVYEHGVGVRSGSSSAQHPIHRTAEEFESQPRDPEDRPVAATDEHARREKGLDKTLADSFPTSDPPSSIPDPEVEP